MKTEESSRVKPIIANTWQFILACIIGVSVVLLIYALQSVGPEAAPPFGKCAAQLKQIGIALHMYSNNYGGYFPERLEQLAEDGKYVSQELFYCPARKEPRPGQIDYVYLREIPLDTATKEPIVFDKKGNHAKGRYVLFSDMNVGWVAEADFHKLYGHLERANVAEAATPLG